MPGWPSLLPTPGLPTRSSACPWPVPRLLRPAGTTPPHPPPSDAMHEIPGNSCRELQSRKRPGRRRPAARTHPRRLARLESADFRPSSHYPGPAARGAAKRPQKIAEQWCHSNRRRLRRIAAGRSRRLLPPAPGIPRGPWTDTGPAMPAGNSPDRTG